MKKQSVLKQIGIGSFFGIISALTGQLNDPHPPSMLSIEFVALMFGGAIGGVFLYMLLYYFWPKKK